MTYSIRSRPQPYLYYAMGRIAYWLKRNPLRLLQYLDPAKVSRSIAAHRRNEDFRLGRNITGRERQSREFASDSWSKDQVVARRRFTDYDEYVRVQVSKLELIKDRLKDHEDNRYRRFIDMFTACPELRDCHSVLCLGARLGTEVKALIDLRHLAIGIDLYPGADNEYVLKGDFHHLVFADQSFDAAYTNVMDHAMDVERKLAEISRILKPGGLFIMDISRGYSEGYVPDTVYSALAWSSAREFVDFVAQTGNFQLLRHYDLPDAPWTQALMRKP